MDQVKHETNLDVNIQDYGNGPEIVDILKNNVSIIDLFSALEIECILKECIEQNGRI